MERDIAWSIKYFGAGAKPSIKQKKFFLENYNTDFVTFSGEKEKFLKSRDDTRYTSLR